MTLTASQNLTCKRKLLNDSPSVQTRRNVVIISFNRRKSSPAIFSTSSETKRSQRALCGKKCQTHFPAIRCPKLKICIYGLRITVTVPNWRRRTGGIWNSPEISKPNRSSELGPLEKKHESHWGLHSSGILSNSVSWHVVYCSLPFYLFFDPLISIYFQIIPIFWSILY